MRWRRKEEISRLEAKAKDHFSFIDFHQFPEANEKNWNMIFFIIKAWNFLIKIYLPLISHAKTLNDRKEFFFSWIERVSIDWNISINIHLSLSRNWSRSFSHTHTKDPTGVFKWNSESKELSETATTLFSSINYELFRVINISIWVVHITESDVGANENLYIKKRETLKIM